MRYWVYNASTGEPTGPFEVADLPTLREFGPETYVAPEDGETEDSWQPARTFDGLRAVLPGLAPEPALGPPEEKPSEPTPAPRRRAVSAGGKRAIQVVIAGLVCLFIATAVLGLLLRRRPPDTEAARKPAAESFTRETIYGSPQPAALPEPAKSPAQPEVVQPTVAKTPSRAVKRHARHARKSRPKPAAAELKPAEIPELPTLPGMSSPIGAH